MATRTATCSCRKLRVTCAGDPIKISMCHCLECQRRTGSTYGIAAFFARKDVEANGDFRTYRRGSDSGFAVNLHFCPDCGSTVFWEPERRPDAIAIAVGSFADPTFPAPSQSVYNELRLPLGVVLKLSNLPFKAPPRGTTTAQLCNVPILAKLLPQHIGQYI